MGTLNEILQWLFIFQIALWLVDHKRQTNKRINELKPKHENKNKQL